MADPDPAEVPPTTEQLDEDALDVDPLEEGAEPPDAWKPLGDELPEEAADDELGEELLDDELDNELLDEDEVDDALPDEDGLAVGEPTAGGDSESDDGSLARRLAAEEPDVD